MNSKKSARLAILIAYGQDHFSLIINFITSVIIARLLTPSEIGVYSIAMVFVVIAHRFRDFGVTEYLIQAPNLSSREVQSALGLNIVFASLAALALYCLSGLLAEFYGEAGVESVLIVLSVSFLLLPFGSQVVAVLKREFCYGRLFVIGLSGTVANATFAIWLAIEGQGYMSLAWAALAGTVATVIVANVYRPSWVPFIPRFRGFKGALNFGGMTAMSSLIQSSSQGVPELFLGKVSGFHDAGLFSRGYGLIRLFNELVMSAANNVALPALARAVRESRNISVLYLRFVDVFSALAIPFFLFIAAFADGIILLFYGDQWGDAILPARILAVGAMFTFMTPLWSRVFLALGQAKRYLIIQSAISLVLVIFVAVGVCWELVGVALGVAAAQAVSAAYVIQMLKVALGLSIRQFLRSFRISILIGVVSVAPAVLLVKWMKLHIQLDVVMEILISGSTVGVLWLTIIILIKHPIRDELQRVISHAVQTVKRWCSKNDAS